MQPHGRAVARAVAGADARAEVPAGVSSGHPLLAAVPLHAQQELSRLVLSGSSVQSVLQRVAELATDLPAVGEASVTLVRGVTPSTAASTGLAAHELDEIQYGLGHGPCLYAAVTAEVVAITDIRTETRWPAYAELAEQKGTLSSLSVPVPLTVATTASPATAALNLYSAGPRTHGADTVEAVRGFAVHAGVVLSNMIALEAARQSAEGLVVAMRSRAVIEQATGILMGRLHVTADDAFARLSQQSQQENCELHDLAQELVDQSLTPGARP